MNIKFHDITVQEYESFMQIIKLKITDHYNLQMLKFRLINSLVYKRLSIIFSLSIHYIEELALWWYRWSALLKFRKTYRSKSG